MSVLRLLEKIDAFRQPSIVADFVAACEADARGRKGLQDREYPQGEFLENAFRAASAIRARDLGLEGLSGPEVGKRLHESRVEAIGRISRDATRG